MESRTKPQTTEEFRNFVATIKPDVDEILNNGDEAAIAPHTDSLRQKLADIPHFLQKSVLEAAAGDPDRIERLGVVFQPVPITI